MMPYRTSVRRAIPLYSRSFLKHAVPAVFAATVLLQGCATIFSGAKQSISIHTNIDSTHITIARPNGTPVYSGRTPAEVKLKRGAGYFKKAAYLVTLSADGYQSKQVLLKFTLNGIYFGNALIGGLVGLVVIDPLTGAMWVTKTGTINEVMIPE